MDEVLKELFTVFGTNVILDLLMLIFGIIMRVGHNKPNRLFGYRSARAQSSAEAQSFANKHCGRLWIITGAVLTLASIAVGVFLYYKGVEPPEIGRAGIVLLILQTIIIMLSLIPTERELKRLFNSEGKQRRDLR